MSILESCCVRTSSGDVPACGLDQRLVQTPLSFAACVRIAPVTSRWSRPVMTGSGTVELSVDQMVLALEDAELRFISTARLTEGQLVLSVPPAVWKPRTLLSFFPDITRLFIHSPGPKNPISLIPRSASYVPIRLGEARKPAGRMFNVQVKDSTHCYVTSNGLVCLAMEV